jgi:hypothetical protein
LGRLSDGVVRAVRAPAQPFVRYFNRRFADVHGHLDNESVAVNARLEETLATMRALQERMATDVEVVSELTLGLERIASRLEERVDALAAELEQLRSRDDRA